MIPCSVLLLFFFVIYFDLYIFFLLMVFVSNCVFVDYINRGGYYLYLSRF